MGSENIFKTNLINCINMNVNNKMDIEDFFKKIEHDKKLSIYRHINVSYNSKGNKIPKGEKIYM